MNWNEAAPDMGASCGVRLKQARESAGLSQEDVAASLKIPVRVIRQLESGDPSQLGAPVFVRGQMRSYARLLGVTLEDELGQSAAPVAPSVLVSHTHTPRVRRVFEQATRRAIYIVLTAAIAVPIWMASKQQLGNDGPKVETLEVATAPAESTRSPATAAPASTHRTPLVASMAAIPAPAAQPALALTFKGESWVEVRGADGRTLEKGLLDAGEQRTYGAGEVSRIVLGNSAAVEVRQSGKPVDLTSFSRDNVARFTLSSDGSLTPGD